MYQEALIGLFARVATFRVAWLPHGYEIAGSIPSKHYICLENCFNAKLPARFKFLAYLWATSLGQLA